MYHRSMRVSVLSHVTLCGDTLFTCQGLGLPACELFMVRSLFIFVPTLLLHRKYNDFMEVHREGDEFAQTPQHSAAKSRNQGLGEEREGRWPCLSTSLLLTHRHPTPSKAAREWLTQSYLVPPQGRVSLRPRAWAASCICWGLVKGLPTWLKNIFNINLNQNYTTMMDFYWKVFCHEFYGADLIFYVALLLYFQFFSILIILKWFWLPSVVFRVNIYPPSALYLDHILANYCICHCEFNCAFYSDQIQFPQSHFLSLSFVQICFSLQLVSSHTRF